MSIDEPITAIRNHLKLESISETPFVGMVLSAVAKLPFLPPPLGAAIDGLKAYIDIESGRRMEVMLNTCADEINRLCKQTEHLSQKVSLLESKASSSAEEQLQSRELAAGLLFDAARKASLTRDEARVKRIGVILAHGLSLNRTDEADEIEEMMRIATELSDRDVAYLGELVKLEGSLVRTSGRITRYDAHYHWENSPLGRKQDPEVESTFSKLTSYGLVWRLPAQNNLNVMADIQNGYGLLSKGLRFADLIASGQALV